MTEKLLTTEQVSQILQVHPLTVLKYIKAGKLQGIKLGRVWRIRETEVEKFLEDRSMVLFTSKDEDSNSNVDTTPIEIEKTLSTEQNSQEEETHDHYIL